MFRFVFFFGFFSLTIALQEYYRFALELYSCIPHVACLEFKVYKSDKETLQPVALV